MRTTYKTVSARLVGENGFINILCPRKNELIFALRQHNIISSPNLTNLALAKMLHLANISKQWEFFDEPLDKRIVSRGLQITGRHKGEEIVLVDDSQVAEGYFDMIAKRIIHLPLTQETVLKELQSEPPIDRMTAFRAFKKTFDRLMSKWSDRELVLTYLDRLVLMNKIELISYKKGISFDFVEINGRHYAFFKIK